MNVRNLHRRLAQVSAAALVTAHAPAVAQDGGERAENQIIVTGTSDGYVAANSVTATKTDTPLIDVPQSVNVVTREQRGPALRRRGSVRGRACSHAHGSAGRRAAQRGRVAGSLAAAHRAGSS